MTTRIRFHIAAPRRQCVDFYFFLVICIGLLTACSSSSDDPAAEHILIGKIGTSDFQENTLDILDPALNSGQSTAVEVFLANNNGTPYTTPVEISFNASCASSSIMPALVETNGGVARVEYTAGNCEGTDTVTATATVNGNNLVATGNVVITRPVVIALGITDNTLNDGEATRLFATLAYNNGDPYNIPTNISFSTTCDSSGFLPDLLTTSGGAVATQYTAGICEGTDTVRASAVVNGVEIAAMGNITIARTVTLAIAVDNAALSTGGSANVSATLKYNDNSAYPVVTAVLFTTTCASSAVAPSLNQTFGGIAVSTYVAGSCPGNDTITAMAVVNGVQLAVETQINIATPVINLAFGSGSGVTFSQGTLATGTGNVGAGQSALASGGSTSVTSTLVDLSNNSALYTQSTAQVHFTSPCAEAGLATLTTPVSIASGVASTVYLDNGCSGSDAIFATVSVNGNIHPAISTITIAPVAVGTIQFISSSPQKITLAGLAVNLPDTSAVTFRVVNNSGSPIQHQPVTFSLNTNIGGISLSSLSTVTDTDGLATTIVQSGTVPASVVVTAFTTDAGSGIEYSTQSAQITISSGVPEQGKISLSISECNPAAWDVNGVTVTANVLALDHFDNPVLDGTAMSFMVEGGAIDGSCLTINGQCSVNWFSQAPRPGEPGQLGRATILVTTDGSESFTDLNANNVFDNGDVMGPDLAEAWLDANEDNSYDAGVEQYLDFNVDSMYTSSNTLYDGVLCQHSTLCAGNNSVHVRQSTVIHMASNNNIISINGGNGNNTDFTLPLSTDAPVPVSITVNSTTGHYPTTGTIISVETLNGTIIGTSDFLVPENCSTVPGQGYETTVNMRGDGIAGSGTLTVTVTSNGVSSQQTVNVSDLAE